MFVIDMFSRRIVERRAQRTIDNRLVLDTLQQALHDRPRTTGLVVHSDHGSKIRIPSLHHASGSGGRRALCRQRGRCL